MNKMSAAIKLFSFNGLQPKACPLFIALLKINSSNIDFANVELVGV